MDNRETLRLDELKRTLQYMKYVNHPVSEADLIYLEGALGVRVPFEYREFLQYIGHGAGPHALWSPDRILAELGRDKKGQESLPEGSANLDNLKMILEASESLKDLREFLGADDVEGFHTILSEYKRKNPDAPLPNRPFHFTRAQAEEYNRSVPEESVRPWLFGLYPANGSIAFADEAEVTYYVLAVTGDAAGSVWEVTGEFLMGWRPARRPPGVLHTYWSGRNPLPALSATPSFLEWYCSWIEQCLVDLCPDPGGYLDLGLAYQHIGEYSAAVENWDKAIEMTPGNSLAYYYRGLALLGLQQMVEAAVDFRRCLAQNPDPWTRARAENQLGGLGAI